MIEAIKTFLRNRSLKKDASREATGFVPLSKVKSAVAFIDVEDTSFDACKLYLQAFYRDHNIKGDIFFLDFRKITKEERLITSITTTVLRKDLNWYGKPSDEKVRLLLGSEPDLFISLIKENSYPLEYMANRSQAKFKIGRQQIFGKVFDLVVNDPAEKTLNEAEAFLAIRKLLEKVV
ncbi:MAG: hypothetical protein K5984_04795 [Bacteroidales bacterium]|nr:hypothetical protein [Bacteroidales bacterium]